ncbi:MAG: heme ABC transporter permease CcmB [Firmicutes bacterium]|nr:heme ABC transporter permease CcmB [Bacillota bacterium]
MIKRLPWVSRGLAIWCKDLRIEFRTRYAYSALLMFAFTTLVAVSFAVGGVVLDAGLAAALLWVILFFAAMAGLSRTFVQEEEAGTVTALKLAARPEPVFIGKYLFNVTLLFSLAVLVVPLFLVLIHQTVAYPFPFLAVVLLGVAGLAGASTIVAAIVARAGTRGPLMTVLAFPILLPLLLGAICGTRTCFAGERAVAADILFLFCYNGAALAVSLLLFPYVWDE